MNTPDLWYIRRLQLHKTLPKSVLDVIREEGRIERWGHAASIDTQRDLDEVHLILGGKVNIRPDATNSRKVTSIGRGDLFGSLRLRQDAEDAARELLSAYDPVTLAVLSREHFERLVTPHIEQVSFRGPLFPLANRITLELPWQSLLYTSPAVRLAKSLIHLAEEAGDPLRERDILLEVPARAKELALLLGLAPTSLEQPLRHFIQRGLVIPENRHALRIASLEPLRKAAQGHTLF